MRDGPGSALFDVADCLDVAGVRISYHAVHEPAFGIPREFFLRFLSQCRTRDRTAGLRWWLRRGCWNAGSTEQGSPAAASSRPLWSDGHGDTALPSITSEMLATVELIGRQGRFKVERLPNAPPRVYFPDPGIPRIGPLDPDGSNVSASCA